MSKVWTLEETRAKLQEIADSKPDGYEYEYIKYENEYGDVLSASTCAYTTRDGEPSCIVGYVLADFEPEILKQINDVEWGGGGTEPYSCGIANVNNYMQVDLTDRFEPEAFALLRRAQNAQDFGATWQAAAHR